MYIYIYLMSNAIWRESKKIHGLIGGKGEWIFGGNNFSPIIIIKRKRVRSV